MRKDRANRCIGVAIVIDAVSPRFYYYRRCNSAIVCHPGHVADLRVYTPLAIPQLLFISSPTRSAIFLRPEMISRMRGKDYRLISDTFLLERNFSTEISSIENPLLPLISSFSLGKRIWGISNFAKSEFFLRNCLSVFKFKKFFKTSSFYVSSSFASEKFLFSTIV